MTVPNEIPSTPASTPEHLFPTLTPSQLERIAAYGKRRTKAVGELLSTPGVRTQSFFVVESGGIEVFQRGDTGDRVIVTFSPGQFNGEAGILSGLPGLTGVRATAPSEVVEIDRAGLLGLVQGDGDLGQLLMRAFILRRVEMIRQGVGDAVVVGSRHTPGTLRIREFLARNRHPYASLDLDSDAGAQALLDRFGVEASEIPVVICRGEVVLRNPTNREVADCLGYNSAVDVGQVRDVVIVGAGPAGLAAAVYGASEGLDVLVIEASAPGGQAGSSSRIENYLGFPAGVSGDELAERAQTQARKFGADLMIANQAINLDCARVPYVVTIDGAQEVSTRTVIIASGAEYRRLELPNLAAFEGEGVYYAATWTESQFCGGDEVAVVGGGNSAGQAAAFLAETARHVHMVVRADGLASTMSRYLIRRIEDHPRITVHARTEVAALEGDDHLSQVTLRNRDSGEMVTHPIRHLFSMVGASPNSGWLHGCVALDATGFVRTGTDLGADDLTAARWALRRRPYPLETTLPGVFAVGDVRSGSMKRVASAVGEGSVAISSVHHVLAE